LLPPEPKAYSGKSSVFNLCGHKPQHTEDKDFEYFIELLCEIFISRAGFLNLHSKK
jgi:hypothetical protein